MMGAVGADGSVCAMRGTGRVRVCARARHARADSGRVRLVRWRCEGGEDAAAATTTLSWAPPAVREAELAFTRALEASMRAVEARRAVVRAVEAWEK
jgi:hypothetical protein